jgi:hypothetical protein
MQEVIREYPVATLKNTYAQPLSGLRVSWGSVLAGTVTTVAVSIILFALALAIVSLAAHPTAASFRGSIAILWICGMFTTLVGAFIGGIVAGYLPGNPRPVIAVTHAFLGWALALVLATGMQAYLLRGALMATADAMADTAAMEGEMGNADVARNDVRVAPPTHEQLVQAGRTGLDQVAAASWSWFGTWFVAGILAVAGAGIGVRRLTRGKNVYIERDVAPGPLSERTS